MSLSGSTGSPSKDSGPSANSSMAMSVFVVAETDPNNLPRDFSRPSLFSAGLTTSSQQERFSCLGHAEHSLSCMKKYLQAGKLCDVVLIAGQNGKRVSAHKLVLSAASEYLATMFTGSLSNDGQTEITLVDMNGDVLQAVVNYCYTGTIEIGVDNVETLLATACLMLLHEVVEACSRFIAHHLHPSNCLGIAILAEHQSCTSLLNEANAYTSQHFMQVILNKEFLQLNVDQMCNLLSSDDLNVSCEEHIFNALMSWVQHDPVKREKHIGQLLALVRLPFLTPAFLSDEVEQAVGNNLTCQKLIMEAMKWHLLPERRDQMTCSRTKPRKATIDRLMIVGVANFNSQNGCQKCTITGEYSYTSRTNYYPRRVCSKRTDHDFRSKLYGLHHKLDSPLLKLPIDMIQDFPIADSLHLIDLGITKRCLTGWRDGNFGLYKTKWSAKDIENISKFLIKCRMPAEIHRAVRGLDCLAHWKGLEYRTFLHYISIVVLQQYLPSDAYQHFLLFFCAITICSSEHYKNLLNFAQKLLEQFVEYYGDFYGADYITSNVHNLYHVVDDVKRFGILPKISAYPFESKLFQIKNLLRTGHKPLVQAAKRLQEQSQIGSIEKVEATLQPFLKKEIFNIDTIYSDHLTGLSNAQFYSCIKLKEYSLRSDLENNWILNNKKEIISFKFAVLQDNVISIIGCRLKHIFDYFDTPIKSSFLNIYSSNCEEGLPKIFKLEEIKCKMVRVSEPENKCFVFIPLLHTLSF